MPTHKPAIDRMVMTKEMLVITGLPISTVYFLMKSDLFPRNLKVTRKRVAWRESDLRQWIDSRQAYSAKAA